MTQLSTEVKDLALGADVADLGDALEIIEQRETLFRKVLAVAIGATGPGDWIDQAGKPWLQASGAEKVARRFGVRISDITSEREDIEDLNGTYYMYTTTGKAALGGGRDELTAIGVCTSRDRFFGKADGAFKATADVDMANIKRKSYTNFLSNAITRLLGIRNLTWDELAKYGISKGGKTSVKYDGGASKAAGTKQSANAEAAAKKPFWTNEWKGKTYINARAGKHFSKEFLENLGLKESQKTQGCWGGLLTEEILAALNDEYAAAEETLAIQAEGGAS